MPIRWRLTLWFALILLVILLFSDVLLNTLLQNYLINDVDSHLQGYSTQVHGNVTPLVPGQTDEVIHSQLPPINEFSSPGTYIQIIDTSGTIVAKSDNLGDLDLPVDPTLIERAIAGGTAIRTVPAGGNAEVRIMVSVLHMTDRTLVLEVAQSLTPVTNALHQFRLAVIIGSSSALLLTTILGAIIVRRTLDPVERITETARAIEEGSNLDRRVGYKGPRDEIGKLANTFDHMIERLEQSFESQKHFVADASHELRTPLTVIQGNLDLLKRNISEDDRQESLTAIESEAKRLTKIASDLLLLVEVEAGQANKKDIVSLKTMLIEEQKRAQSRGGNRIIVLGRLDDLSVKGDIYKLNQVLSNLVDNAIKYSSDDSTISLSLIREGEWAKLAVADNGIGINPENLPHLFDRFYRVDKARSRKQGGTGLGLAIVKGIVEQHGGKVTVTSEPGKGSVFTVWLKT